MRRNPLTSEDVRRAERLRKARERLHISQSDFSLMIGITRERLQSYETRRARLPERIEEDACAAIRVILCSASRILNEYSAEEDLPLPPATVINQLEAVYNRVREMNTILQGLELEVEQLRGAVERNARLGGAS